MARGSQPVVVAASCRSFLATGSMCSATSTLGESDLWVSSSWMPCGKGICVVWRVFCLCPFSSQTIYDFVGKKCPPPTQLFRFWKTVAKCWLDSKAERISNSKNIHIETITASALSMNVYIYMCNLILLLIHHPFRLYCQKHATSACEYRMFASIVYHFRCGYVLPMFFL